MLELFSAASRAQLRTLLSAMIVFIVGLWAAPSFDHTVALGIAAVIGFVAFGIRALQAYQPKLAFTVWLGHPFGDWADAFTQGFLASISITLPAALAQFSSLSDSKSVIASLLVGALNAGMRALQGALTAGEHPGPSVGLRSPLMPYTYAHPPEA